MVGVLKRTVLSLYLQPPRGWSVQGQSAGMQPDAQPTNRRIQHHNNRRPLVYHSNHKALLSSKQKIATVPGAERRQGDNYITALTAGLKRRSRTVQWHPRDLRIRADAAQTHGNVPRFASA